MSLTQGFESLQQRTSEMVDEWEKIAAVFDKAAEGLRLFMESGREYCPDCEAVVDLVGLRCAECGHDFINEKSI